ncbi:hypothetical protein L6V77_05375 [Myxococcota bacterium]|jgi:hypothetical protein|nr:hypothetical protein [Myxococcota bacterium]
MAATNTLTWLALVTLSVVSVALGRLDVALTVAGAKAILVGLDFMELRAAARPHLVAYLSYVVLLVAVLVLL